MDGKLFFQMFLDCKLTLVSNEANFDPSLLCYKILDITAAVTNLLDKYELGLKIRKVKKLLRTRDGIDLQKISISQGYTDTLEFLEAKMPELNIHYQENRLNCVVQLPAGTRAGLGSDLFCRK